MWNFASHCIAGRMKPDNSPLKPAHAPLECSDDETSSVLSREERLECPICRESFNIVENVPYVLWCGHTLCRNCILGLQWAVVRFPTLPVKLPLFITCPWCNLLSFRLVYLGDLKFPRKNYILLWMVESMNGDCAKSHSTFCGDHCQPVWPIKDNLTRESQVSHCNQLRRQPLCHSEPSDANQDCGYTGNYHDRERLHVSLGKSLAFLIHLATKFPLIILLFLIVLYAIPTSTVILSLYVLVGILFALPSFLILYFAYPSLDWLIREIIT